MKLSGNAGRPLVVHDYFAIRGGGERLVLTLADAVGADLLFGYRSPESYDETMFPPGNRDLNLPMALRRPGLRAAALAARFAMERRRAARHGVRVFSGVAAPFAAPEAGSAGRNIFYCHTPPRFLYDQREHFSSMLGGPTGMLKKAGLAQFRRGFEAAVGRMDTIVANSETVRERIRSFLGRDSTVVYPPCDTKSFVWGGQQGYYLSTARLAGLKRVDRIVDAFRTMPDRQLVVASGGDELENLRRRAKDAPNITFLGWVEEDRLRRLIGEAIATIYVPVEEDFGMSPVESMAAGKPVIGVAEGGLRETIVDGETGILLPPGFRPADIADAVGRLSAPRAAAMRGACEARAEMFSEQRFIAGMRAVVLGAGV
ncbi:glycosyltransferase [Aurantimonas endophytica]|uniref:Glycosyltransferase involved in cell wall biosynthesis n=1 Tax=Aurantimonas endophytica TaxID=1522175 RepID=A0A7W6HDK0_9HYPH|nr:glycosyltransferase [Aurantimonas endophytica]MBB4003057.1 glycosyltransferase involved in cell wall biosynthesis [Aurantimonas endophytica]MCO6403928.1 glycosyltransferase [Aurantimonas endophytica]